MESTSWTTIRMASVSTEGCRLGGPASKSSGGGMVLGMPWKAAISGLKNNAKVGELLDFYGHLALAIRSLRQGIQCEKTTLLLIQLFGSRIEV